MKQINYVGTRWHKCDLHLHTPASKCFKDQKVTPEQWVQAAIDKGLSCVAVTDHNTGEWIDKIKEAAKDTELTVFPGVEITCSDAKVHLLILFDVDKGTKDIEDFLITSEIKREMFGEQEAHSPRSCAQILASCSSFYNSIVIPAHVDEFNGICQMGNQPRKEFLARKEIKGVQVVHQVFTLSDNQYQTELKDGLKIKLNEKYGASPKAMEVGKFKIDDEKLKSWRQAVKQSNQKAILTFSDNPHEPNNPLHGIKGIGTRFTWIKMDKHPSLECLRQALLVPEERIKNDFQIKDGEQPYQIPDVWLEGIKFSSMEITGIEKSIDVFFSPQMTSIVGGRGSGKSSVLSCIRGVFPSYVEELKDVPTIQKEFLQFFRQTDKDKKGVLNKSSEIAVIIRRKKGIYKIEYKVNEGSVSKVYKYNKHKKDWEEEQTEGFIDLFRLDIFSQKQVYELANEPNALRNKLDSDIDGVREIKEELEDIKADFLAHCAEMRKLEQKISRKGALEMEINDIQDRLSTVDADAIKEQLIKLQGFSNQEGELDSFKGELKNQIYKLSNLVNSFQFPNDTPSLLRHPSYKEEFKEIISPLEELFKTIKLEINKFISDGEKSIESFDEKIIVSKWEQDKKVAEEEYEIQQQKLQDGGLQGFLDPTEIEREMDEAQEKKQEVRELEKLEKELEVAQTKKGEIKDKFFLSRDKLTKTRKDFLQGLLTGNVKADVLKCADLDHWEFNFRTIINSFNSYKPELVALQDRWARTRSPKDNNLSYMTIFHSIRNGTFRGNDYSGHFTGRIGKLRPSQMDELDLLAPEDKIVIKYKSNENSAYKPIATASPGQKTAAILTFLLSHGENPLIIDQPEDDLDTSLIHKLVVRQLRDSKKKRQVIVVTHNPNIPVNGDSEHVIVMNSDSKYVETKREGSIDDVEIRELICEVMEGGVEAFNLRAQRYKLS